MALDFLAKGTVDIWLGGVFLGAFHIVDGGLWFFPNSETSSTADRIDGLDRVAAWMRAHPAAAFYTKDPLLDLVFLGEISLFWPGEHSHFLATTIRIDHNTDPIPALTIEFYHAVGFFLRYADFYEVFPTENWKPLPSVPRIGLPWMPAKVVCACTNTVFNLLVSDQDGWRVMATTNPDHDLCHSTAIVIPGLPPVFLHPTRKMAYARGRWRSLNNALIMTVEDSELSAHQKTERRHTETLRAIPQKINNIQPVLDAHWRAMNAFQHPANVLLPS